jgi:hypothetical protein
VVHHEKRQEKKIDMSEYSKETLAALRDDFKLEVGRNLGTGDRKEFNQYLSKIEAHVAAVETLTTLKEEIEDSHNWSDEEVLERFGCVRHALRSLWLQLEIGLSTRSYADYVQFHVLVSLKDISEFLDKSEKKMMNAQTSAESVQVFSEMMAVGSEEGEQFESHPYDEYVTKKIFDFYETLPPMLRRKTIKNVINNKELNTDEYFAEWKKTLSELDDQDKKDRFTAMIHGLVVFYYDPILNSKKINLHDSLQPYALYGYEKTKEIAQRLIGPLHAQIQAGKIESRYLDFINLVDKNVGKFTNSFS